MKNQEEQYYIFLRSTRERVPCTKEEFDNYYRDINAFRKRKQRLGECVCPKSKRLDCDMDCLTCPFKKAGRLRSTDYLGSQDFGDGLWEDVFEDPETSVEEIVSDSIDIDLLLKRLFELMPQAIEVGKLRLEGMSDRQIEGVIGINRKTLIYRLNKLKGILKDEFPEYF